MPKSRRRKTALCCKFKDVNFIDKRLLKNYTVSQIIRDLDNEYPSHGLLPKHIRYHRENHFKPKIEKDVDSVSLEYALQKYDAINAEFVDPLVSMHHSLDIAYKHLLQLRDESIKYQYADPSMLKYIRAVIDGSEKLISARHRLEQKDNVQNARVDQKILAFVENKFEASQEQNDGNVTKSLAVQVKEEELAKRNTTMSKVFEKLENPPEEMLFGKSVALTEDKLMIDDDQSFDNFGIEEMEKKKELV